MADDVSFIIRAQNAASPELKRVADDVRRLGDATTKTQGSFVAWGRAWDTAATGAARSGQGAIGALRGLERAAQDAAQGGLRNLLSEIPIVGGALAKLAGALGGFPLLLGGIVGAGIGVIQFLRGLSDEAGKSLAAITGLAEGIGTKFQQSVLEVQRIAAQAAGDRLGVIELTAQKELAAAEATKADRIAKAQDELTQVSGLWAELTGQRALAEQTFRTEVAAAEADLAMTTVQTHAKKVADLQALERERVAFAQKTGADLAAAESAAQVATLAGRGQVIQALEVEAGQKRALLEEELQDRLAALERMHLDATTAAEQRQQLEATLQAKLVALEQETAERRKGILEGLTSAARGIFEQLGADFETVTGKLKVVEFIQATQQQIEQLTQLKDAIASGDETFKQLGLTQADVDKGLAALTARMQEAVSTGLVPTADAATQASEDLTTLEATAERTASALGTLFNLGEHSPLVDTIEQLVQAGKDAEAAAGKAATGGGGPALGGGGGGSGGTATSSGGGGTEVRLGDVILRSGRQGVGWFQHGGVVPGAGPQPIVAHGGELIGPPETLVRAFELALHRHGTPATGVGPVLRLEAGAIQIHGTAMTARDAATFAEVLAQSLDRRARRRAA